MWCSKRDSPVFFSILQRSKHSLTAVCVLNGTVKPSSRSFFSGFVNFSPNQWVGDSYRLVLYWSFFLCVCMCVYVLLFSSPISRLNVLGKGLSEWMLFTFFLPAMEENR